MVAFSVGQRYEKASVPEKLECTFEGCPVLFTRPESLNRHLVRIHRVRKVEFVCCASLVSCVVDPCCSFRVARPTPL